MASEIVREIDEKFFQCPICLQQLKEPKLLPCLHRFCKECLATLIGAQGRQDVVRCPACRDVFQVPKRGLDGFKTDFLIQNLIDNNNLIQRSLDKHYHIQKFSDSLETRKVSEHHSNFSAFNFHLNNNITKDHPLCSEPVETQTSHHNYKIDQTSREMTFIEKREALQKEMEKQTYEITEKYRLQEMLRELQLVQLRYNEEDFKLKEQYFAELSKDCEGPASQKQLKYDVVKVPEVPENLQNTEKEMEYLMYTNDRTVLKDIPDVNAASTALTMEIRKNQEHEALTQEIMNYLPDTERRLTFSNQGRGDDFDSKQDLCLQQRIESPDLTAAEPKWLESSVQEQISGDDETIVKENSWSMDQEDFQSNDDCDNPVKVTFDEPRELLLQFSPNQKPDLLEGQSDIHIEDSNVLNSLEASSIISNSGGIVTIPDMGVKLEIPPNALEEGVEDQRIELEILPRRLFDEPAHCFEDHSTTMVQILPNDFQLQRPAKLILPHCLIIGDTKNCEVRVFQSHHKKGEKPVWEDVTELVRTELSKTFCTIWLKHFSWVKCTIQDEEVEAKKLILYTLGEKFFEDFDCITAHVGYYPALPENNVMFRMKLGEMFIGQLQSYIFRKKPISPLIIEVTEIKPDVWKTSSSLKTISYADIELDNEQSRPFLLQREGFTRAFPTCIFKVAQGDTSSELDINMTKGATERNKPSTSGQEHGFLDAVLCKDKYPIGTTTNQAVQSSVILSTGEGVEVRQRREDRTIALSGNLPQLNVTSNWIVQGKMDRNKNRTAVNLCSRDCGMDQVNANNIDDIVDIIFDEWRRIGRRLGVDGFVEEIRQQYPDNPREQVVEMLRKWKELKSNDATLYKLMQVLVSDGFNQKADRVADLLFKTNSN